LPPWSATAFRPAASEGWAAPDRPLAGTAAAIILTPDGRGRRTHEALFGLTALLALVMNVNPHPVNGSLHPWAVPGDGFDEGVDPDSLMPLIEITIIAVSVLDQRRLRRVDEHRSGEE
jgi:hypothetical protein